MPGAALLSGLRIFGSKQQRDRRREDLERAIRSVGAEVADLKATLAELRVALAGETLDLPNPLARRAQVN